MLGRLLSRPAKLPAKEDVVSMAHAVALALSERDGDIPEQQLAAREDEQKSLAQERARSQALELQLAVQRDATPAAGRIATDNSSDIQVSDKPVAAQLPASDKPVMPGNHKSRTLTAPEAPGNGEAARLVTQARLLLDQGKIIAARSVLERAAASDSALALFLLAETYDPAMLSTWGISGRRGNVTKAQQLYAKAVVEGVHEAEYRLSVLR
jgi:hypothetical protein